MTLDEEFCCQPFARRPDVRFCGVGAVVDERARTEKQDEIGDLRANSRLAEIATTLT